jgi:hypothetical protein
VREDSRALLKLLLERGQSYDDIAAVLGGDRDAVRERARDALEELGGERPDPELADYLLGEASPVERADMARRLSADEREAALASELAEHLREIAPGATLPALPAPPGVPRAFDADPAVGAEITDADAAERESRWSQGRVMLALAAIVVVAVGVIVVATGGFGDDDPPAPERASVEELDAVPVDLEPTGGGDAGGEAVLGLATGDQPFVDLNLHDLEPIEPSDAYILWLMVSEDRGWPLGLIEPDQQGSQSDRYPVPSFLLQTNIVKGLRSIVVSRSPRKEALEAADDAAESGVPEVDFVGEVVLSGDVPTAGAPAPRG